MKAKFTVILLSLLPFIVNACSCLYIETFCEAITPESNVRTVRIIEKFNSPDSMSTYLLVEKIEDLMGTPSKDTMTILAGYGTSCDPNHYSLTSGDSMLINHQTPTFMLGDIPYDTSLGHICSRNFLPIENGKIHDGISDEYDETIDYSSFKINIVDCAKLSVLDDPEFLNKVLYIYPNPAKDFLRFGLDFNANFSYQIYDVSGRLISQEQPTARHQEVDLTHFQKGIYFIKFLINETFVVKKFVKL